MRIRTLAVAVGGLALLASCGNAPVDTAAVESNVISSIDGPGSVQVDAVDCPQDVDPEVGATFTCAYVLTDGSAGEVTVTLADEDGAGTWEVTKPASGQAEQVVLTDYAEQVGRKPTSVDCPDPLKGGAKARSVCEIEFANGETRAVNVTYDGGDIRWRTR